MPRPAISASLLLLLLLAVPARPDFDNDVCTPFKESYGLIPPPLPRNFEMRGEHIDHNGKVAFYQEILLDFSENRGKYLYLVGGVEHHLLFDYDTHQVVEWDKVHPGADIKDDPLSHECVAKELDDSEHRDIFGYLDINSDFPKMFDSHKMLRFGGKYAYAFNGTDPMPERGLISDLFVGCVYDDQLDATVRVNYSFTNEVVNPSAGTPSALVTGFEDGLLSVPARAVVVGTAYDSDTRQRSTVNRTEHTFWFSGEPDFKMDAFRIPPYMYCEKYRGRRDMAPFPPAFAARVQKTEILRDSLGSLAAGEVASFEEIFYYQERQLARRDFTPDRHLDTEIFNMFNSPAPVSMIYDFSTGVVYVIHQSTGRCYARPILQGDYFEASGESHFVQMGGPEEVFQMQHDFMEHRGTDFTRDIECDVFSGKYYDKRYNATFHKETYVSTNGWHEEVDQYVEYNVPVKHTIITAELNGELVEGVTSYHFFKFIAENPSVVDFNVDSCIETFKRTDFSLLLDLTNDEKKAVFSYKALFLEEAQYYLADISEVDTPLRVQRMEVRQVRADDRNIHLLFTLVDKANLKTQVLTGQPGPSLEVASLNLAGYVNANLFKLKFRPPGAKEALEIKAKKGSLYVREADGSLEAPRRPGTQPWAEFADDVAEAKKPDKDEEGMSTTGLTLLALAMLFVGCGIGVAIMYLYQRKFNESSLEDRITLTPQASVEEGASSGVANYSA